MSVPRRKGRYRRKGIPRKDPGIGRELDVEIEAIGRSGDGIATLEDQPAFIPLTLPGDRLRIRLTAKLADGYAAEIIEVQKQSRRAVPACPHFGSCGGCQLQHLPIDSYHQWKMQQIRTALDQRGLTGVDIRPIIRGERAARRRLRLAFPPVANRRPHKSKAERVVGAVKLGFRSRRSREIVVIDRCPIALPALIAILEPLKVLLCGLDLADQGGDIQLTATETGLDLLLQAPLAPVLADLEILGAFADKHDLARLAFRRDANSEPEPIAARRPAGVTMGGIPVDLPIGAFLQATEQAEIAIREAVNEAIGKGQTIADLFSGCGTFGLPLAAMGRDVIAFERDQAMVGAMKAAAKAAGIGHRLTADTRDLERQPLDQSDLNGLDAAIVDPPRAGARSQAQALAASTVEKIAMVSCNPATFARDARLLVDGGYRLSWVQPIDAFLWSAEIEQVGAFERPYPLDSN